MFENRRIAGLFANSLRMQGKKCRDPFGFRDFLTQHPPLFLDVPTMENPFAGAEGQFFIDCVAIYKKLFD
ncbi:hypothetical protein [Anaerotruncus colihominis]|uniref:hypothetical protein n=2 Tax=Anaerotruncus TaxID=244127 RepID=UPI0026EBF7CB|nr:hypothetical protein [Anaerotruncus colihominis]